jgi:large subunit ribosomal protein L17
MRHNVAQKKLGRSTPHRRAMLRNITTDFFRNERCETTLAKARALKPVAEKLITLARTDTLAARRKAYGYIFDKAVVHKLFAEIAPRYKTRPGGYTRLLKTGVRQGDASDMALLELVADA